MGKVKRFNLLLEIGKDVNGPNMLRVEMNRDFSHH